MMPVDRVWVPIETVSNVASKAVFLNTDTVVEDALAKSVNSWNTFSVVGVSWESGMYRVVAGNWKVNEGVSEGRSFNAGSIEIGTVSDALTQTSLGVPLGGMTVAIPGAEATSRGVFISRSG